MMNPDSTLNRLESRRHRPDQSGTEAVHRPAPAGDRLDRILVVDDESAIREVLKEYLSMQGYRVMTASDGREAVPILEETEFDLIITDLSMPRLDGFGLMKVALEIQPYTTIIVLSGRGTFENAVKAVHQGAYDFVAKPVKDFNSFKIAVDRGLEHKALLMSQKNYQENLERMVDEQTQELARTNRLLKHYADELENVSLSFITSLMSALEEKDQYTAGHSHRVTFYAMGMGRNLDLNSEDLWRLQTAAQLHDMGKLMIDLSYVNKPGPLTPEEWHIMKEHPAAADRFLAPLPFLKNVRPLIRHHHERMDGSGYPDGLRGEEVCLLTQVLAVADSFDAMTSHRSYRSPMPREAALTELGRFVGIQFTEKPIRALAEFVKHSTVDLKHLPRNGQDYLLAKPKSWMMRD